MSAPPAFTSPRTAWLAVLAMVVLAGVLGLTTGWPLGDTGLDTPPVAGGEAPAPVTLSADAPRLSFTGRARYLRDPQGRLDLEAVLGAPASRWQPSTQREIPGGFMTQGALWVQLAVRAPTHIDSPWWLEVADDLIDHIELYQRIDGGPWNRRLGGRALPFAARELPWHRHAFALDLRPGQVTEVLIRARSVSTLRLRPQVFEQRALLDFQARENLFLGSYLGIMGAVLLASLYRSVRTPSAVNLSYSGYTLGLEGAKFVLIGWFQQLGLSEHLGLRQALIPGGLVLAGTSLLLFARHVIEWPAPRRYDRALHALLALYGGAFVLVLLLSREHATMYGNAGSLLLLMLSGGAASWAAWKGYAHARPLLVGYLPFVAFALLQLAASFGIETGWTDLHYGYFACTLLHVLILLLVVMSREAALARATEQLRWKVERLREDVSNQGLFIRMIAHEIRTPLAQVDSHSQLLAREAGSEPAAVARVGRIRAGIAHMSRLLERVLQQDQQATIASVRREPVDLAEVIRTVCAEVQRETEQHLIRVVAAAGALPIEGDRALLEVLLRNLLENALRYSPEGGAVEVRAGLEAGGAPWLEVSDEGVGIPPEALPRIFERYYRTGQVQEAVGAGLGLYIVRRIAQAHGGDVAVESVLGQGSTFRVRLAPR